MNTPSIAHRLYRRLGGRRPAPAILMYHRVAELEQDPWGMAVSPEIFGQQLAYLKRHRTTMPLDQLVEGVRNRNLPRDAVAITFDDGYRDNLVNAKPLLMDYGLPATLFLPTGWVGSSVPFWWDELAEWTLLSRQKVSHTELVGNETFLMRWDEPEPADADKAWRASSEPRTPRQKAYISLWRKLRDLTQGERLRVLESLRGRFRGVCPLLSLPMNRSEIQELIQDGLITIGAHTVHHPALTCLSTEECKKEILDSIEQCRIATGVEVTSFAYPYGDMNERVREIVSRAGFSSACSTRGAHLNSDCEDLYGLPRLAVPNSDIAQFKAMLIS
jgi:peptidoglycan/xylan/chitin deacetylase (PgdA/CDA1 family)